jgi:carbonic anhydrase
VRKTASLTDAAVKANAAAAKSFRRSEGKRPTNKLAIVTCMDPRLNGMVRRLGLNEREVGVIRNAGGIINEDSIRSLLIVTRVLGAREIMVINHTDCGMARFQGRDLKRELERTTGEAPVSPARFYSFLDPEENVRKQVRRVKSHPWILKDIPVRGFVYDVFTGRLREVEASAPAKKSN